MKALLLFIVGIFLIESSCLAFTCSVCDVDRCPKKPVDCHYGWTLDACQCCPVCYKGPGERCSLRWNVCAKPFRCVKFEVDENSPSTEVYPATIGPFEEGICHG